MLPVTMDAASYFDIVTLALSFFSVATADIGKIASRRLITNDFMAVPLLVYVEKHVLTVAHTRYTIIYYTVAEDVFLLHAVVVAEDAEHESRQKLYVVFEWLCYVVVELVAVGACVHTIVRSNKAESTETASSRN